MGTATTDGKHRRGHGRIECVMNENERMEHHVEERDKKGNGRHDDNRGDERGWEACLVGGKAHKGHESWQKVQMMLGGIWKYLGLVWKDHGVLRKRRWIA